MNEAFVDDVPGPADLKDAFSFDWTFVVPYVKTNDTPQAFRSILMSILRQESSRTSIGNTKSLPPLWQRDVTSRLALPSTACEMQRKCTESSEKALYETQMSGVWEEIP